jgi:hypothetical protein
MYSFHWLRRWFREEQRPASIPVTAVFSDGEWTERKAFAKFGAAVGEFAHLRSFIGVVETS